MIIVIGRGHSGTRIIPQILTKNGVFMGGHRMEGRGDLTPAQPIYALAFLAGRQTKLIDCHNWNFSNLVNSNQYTDIFDRLIKQYLQPILNHDNPRGWKLPENTLIYPWLVRYFPEAYFIYMIRDPRDVILGEHLTDALNRFNIPHCPNFKSIYEQRAISCKYQHDIIYSTPKPKHFIKIRFEDIVLNQTLQLERLSRFLDIPLDNQIRMNSSKVARWHKAKVFTKFSFLKPICNKHNYIW